jgi:TATA-binding protein-associated factor
MNKSEANWYISVSHEKKQHILPTPYHVQMPSHTAASALISLYAIDEAPWKWPQWQAITGIHHGPFPEKDELLPRGWTRQDADDIQSYFKQYSEIDGEERKIKFARGHGGSAVPGRTKWNAYIRKSWEAWKIHNLIVTGLRQEDIHPFQITARESDDRYVHHSRSLPRSTSDDGCSSWPNADLYIPLALDPVGDAIFGQEAFGDSSRLPAKLRRPLTVIIQRSWARLRVKSKADEKRLVAMEEQATTAFTCAFIYLLVNLIFEHLQLS